MNAIAKVVVCALGAALLSGCGQQQAYKHDSFDSDSHFKLKVDADTTTACEGARRSLLGQGYLIDKSGADQVIARKARRNEDKLNTYIEMNVVCVADRIGSTLYATAMLSTYDLKKSSSAASVGLSAVGTISLPIGQSADSLVKIGEETIDDAEYYRRFFAVVTHTLNEMSVREDPETAPAVATVPEPPTVPEPGTVPEPMTEPEPSAMPAAAVIPETPVSVHAAPDAAPQPVTVEPAPLPIPVPVPVPEAAPREPAMSEPVLVPEAAPPEAAPPEAAPPEPEMTPIEQSPAPAQDAPLPEDVAPEEPDVFAAPAMSPLP